MRILALWLAVGVVWACAAGAARADDLNPPVWRGLPGTTFQQWEFPTANPMPLPDVVVNPYGQDGAQVWPGTGQQWWTIWGGREGVWPLSGAMEFYIPNQPIANEYKDVWIQITWAKQAFMSAPILSSNPAGTVQLLTQVDIGPTGEPPPAGANWWHSTYTIRIYPNPNFETIRIDGTIMVDEVVIDTICIPEPAGLAVLACGALAFTLRRR